MDTEKTKGLLRSETALWAYTAGIAYVVQRFGLPALPAEVQGEVVSAISDALTVAIPAIMMLAADARRRATVAIKGIW